MAIPFGLLNPQQADDASILALIRRMNEDQIFAFSGTDEDPFRNTMEEWAADFQEPIPALEVVRNAFLGRHRAAVIQACLREMRRDVMVVGIARIVAFISFDGSQQRTLLLEAMFQSIVDYCDDNEVALLLFVLSHNAYELDEDDGHAILFSIPETERFVNTYLSSSQECLNRLVIMARELEPAQPFFRLCAYTLINEAYRYGNGSVRARIVQLNNDFTRTVKEDERYPLLSVEERDRLNAQLEDEVSALLGMDETPSTRAQPLPTPPSRVGINRRQD